MDRQIPNRTLFTGDNLPILRGINGASVDLVYLDPPFNSNKHYSAPVGSEAAGASFKDAWTLNDEDEAWHAALKSHHPKLYAIIHAAGTVGGKGDKSYLIYMTVRILEMHRALKSTGSLYLHCDPSMSHSLKLVLDAVFGRTNFHNEIVWHYYNKFGAGSRVFGRNYDQIFFYSKDSKKYRFNPLREARDKPVKQLERENVDGVLKNKRGADGKVLYRIVDDKKVDAVWRIPCVQPASKHYTGYPTQKPLSLLKRIIEASSNEGDWVLDPFCGCATTCIAAEILHRRWIGIDISPKALELVKVRLDREVLGKGKVFEGKVISRTDIPHRTDIERITLSKSAMIKRLYGNQAGICNGCELHFPIQNFERDHIVPRAAGGANVLENFQLLCGSCNRIKGDRTMEYLKARLKERAE